MTTPILCIYAVSLALMSIILEINQHNKYVDFSGHILVL